MKPSPGWHSRWPDIVAISPLGMSDVAPYPIASDVLLRLFDQHLTTRRLAEHEKDWGGGIEERMAREAAAYAAR